MHSFFFETHGVLFNSFYLSVKAKFYIIVTQFEKTDLMAQFAQIELLVPLECTFNCASIGAIDAAIGCSVAKL